MPTKPGLASRPVKSTVQERQQRQDARDNERLKRRLEDAQEELRRKDELISRHKILRRENMEQVLGAAGTTYDRCMAMEVMGRALNGEAYQLSLGTREQTASLDAVNEFMASTVASAGSSSTPLTTSSPSPAAGTSRPFMPVLLPSPLARTPSSAGRSHSAISSANTTPAFSPFMPGRLSLPSSTPSRSSLSSHGAASIASRAASPYTPSPPRKLSRSTSAPADVPSSARALFVQPQASPSQASAGNLVDAAAVRNEALPELQTFLHFLTADTGRQSESSLLKKAARNQATVSQVVQTRNLSTTSPFAVAGSLTVYDATSSRNAIDAIAATYGGPSYKKITKIYGEKRHALELPIQWHQHDLHVVADNNQVSLKIALRERTQLYLASIHTKGSQKSLHCSRICEIKGEYAAAARKGCHS